MGRLLFPAAGLCGLALAVVPALAADQTVSTSGNSFVPADVTVAPGEKITIHNGGMGFHDLNWADGAPGQPVENTTDWSTERTFSAADEGKSFVFYCDVHGSATGGMRGVVHVGSGTPSGTTTQGTTTGTTGTTGTTSTSTEPPPPGGTTTTSTTPPPGQTTPAPGADTTSPRVTGVRRTVSRRGVSVRLTLSERATITLRLLRGHRRVARKVVSADAGAVTLKVKKRLRAGRYAIRLTVVDEAGNRSTRSLAARVR